MFSWVSPILIYYIIFIKCKLKEDILHLRASNWQVFPFDSFGSHQSKFKLHDIFDAIKLVVHHWKYINKSCSSDRK